MMLPGLLPPLAQFAFLNSQGLPDHLAGSSTAHDEEDPPISIINLENALMGGGGAHL